MTQTKYVVGAGGGGGGSSEGEEDGAPDGDEDDEDDDEMVDIDEAAAASEGGDEFEEQTEADMIERSCRPRSRSGRAGSIRCAASAAIFPRRLRGTAPMG